jgi:hypothetical protein
LAAAAKALPAGTKAFVDQAEGKLCEGAQLLVAQAGERGEAPSHGWGFRASGEV